MSALNTLIKARALIDTPRKWTKGSFSDRGEYVRYCSIGAIVKTERRKARKAIKTLAMFMPHKHYEYSAFDSRVIYFNDNHNHRQVMEAWDKAIAYLRAERELNKLKRSVKTTPVREEVLA